ncbi:GNAT family N-acetyltransferase [Elizabethkingia argentiflava]|uniref:GNAT family N-acetyltransferase n=1 Tax=Elizabethkingia argenteiflava TaxID=2681556 RepID=A0A845PX27_9FLAO|nr:GNAT family N-acetyltransferase [Elizabethkingia argenteiflava]NAW50650.1 GNAT family N-acetyltransferase [Elizabethkingia argenteiflava]
MKHFPKLETPRLILSSLEKTDIPLIVEYLQEKVISENTSHIPYPYTLADAQNWIIMSEEAFKAKTAYNFAIRKKNGKIIGSIGLHDTEDDKAELGYWIALPFWGKGFATEAAQAVLDFGIKKLGFHKIYASFLLHNIASGKVMKKIGMQREALLKDHVKKGNQYMDVLMFSFIANAST